MKKGKIFSICLALSIVVASFCFIFLSPSSENKTGDNKGQKVYASYSLGETYSNATQDSKNATYLTKSNIPFSLYTSYLPTGSSEYQITDYYPNPVEKTDSRYIMDETSAPYIVMSSKTGSGDSILNELYSTTLTLKFNNASSKLDTSKNYAKIPNLYFSECSLSVKNTYGTTSLYTEFTSTGNDYGYEFNLSLRELTSTSSSSYCPILSKQGDTINYLGGNTNNDVTYRTGLYTLKLIYNYQLDGGTTSEQNQFVINFYVIDYSDYITEDNSAPLEFENASVYTPTLDEGMTMSSKYYLYNYNYQKAPIINYDASKFALNFKYYVGGYENNYFEFLYNGFTPLSSGEYTGYLTLYCSRLDKSYRIYTKNETKTIGTGTNATTKEYSHYASFDLKDFETNFIMTNSNAMSTSVFQGRFEFSLDILASGSGNNFVKVNKDLFKEDVKSNLSFQNLIIYGFDLRYTDSNNRNLSLINDVTHTNILSSSNDQSYFDVPDKIATTNLAPLSFHSYGDLITSSSESYKAQYVFISEFSDTNESAIITALEDAKADNQTDLLNINYFQNKSTSTYNQIANFTSAGIYFVELKYNVNFNTIVQKMEEGQLVKEVKAQTISGTQYVLFEINNSAQELFIHAYEKDDNNQYAYTFNTYTNKNVRVACEAKDNLFTTPSSVVYSMATNYNINNPTSSGTLSFKLKSDGSKDTYQVDGKTYNYFVLNQANDYTFSTSGAYSVSIKRDNDYYPKYSFKIDKNKDFNISINKAIATTNNSYVKGAELTANNLSGTQYIDKDLYITDGAFTLGWEERASGATTNLYVAYMGLKENTTKTPTLIKQSNGAYWLTNNYYFTEISKNAETSYKNSKNLTSLTSTSCFRKEGLYYFFLFDQAGNYSTRAVLIDSSLPTIAQGTWAGDKENSAWTQSYTPSTNPQNYVSADTYLYFGTHKALSFGTEVNNSNEIKITIDKYYNYINRYTINSTDNPVGTQAISFDFKSDVLAKLTSNVQQNNGNKILGDDVTANDYYLVINNSNYQYSYQPTASGTSSYGTQNINNSNYYVALYMFNEDNTDRIFVGEANYEFTITNFANLSTSRKVSMNFEKVKTSFYAYNQSNNPIYVEKNSGTNLKTLRFEYELLNNDDAKYYKIDSLTYSYYPFTTNTSSSNYPFTETPTLSNIDILDKAIAKGNNVYVIDGINVDSSNTTRPGKYVITRKYTGGNYDITTDASGNTTYTLVEKYGSYYKNGDNYLPLFNTDKLEKQYEIYVDNYQIIDSSQGIGQNIYLTLGGDNWKFTDFSKMSNGIDKLATNLTPVTINVPRSKYYASGIRYVASEYKFSDLNLQVTRVLTNGATEVYTSNGFDGNGILTCSALKSSSNKNGYFIFSEDGQYTITITDNTGYNYSTTYDTYSNQSPNKMTFTFSISQSSITAEGYSYVGNNTGTFETTKLTGETANNYSINTQAISPVVEENNRLNKMYLTFDDPATPYITKINQINIYSKLRNKSLAINSLATESLKGWATGELVYAIDKNTYTSYVVNKTELATREYLCYLEVSFYDRDNPSEIFDGKDYYRFTYKLYFTLLEEDTFTIDLKNAVEMATYTLSVDRTKPTTNLDRLLASETFLQNRYKNQLNKFKDENIFSGTETDINRTFYNSPNNLTYSFGVSNNFSLTYNSQDTVSYFYVRSYAKYNGSYPSITPDMLTTIYGTDKNFTSYPRFSEIALVNGVISNGNSTWYKVNYDSSTSLYNQILSVTKSTPQGHYEIIEKDRAGNYRTFTVYFATNSPILEIDGVDNDYQTYGNVTDENLTANTVFSLLKLASKLGWGVLTVRNETLGVNYQKEILLTPPDHPDYNALTSELASLNQFMRAIDVNSRFTYTLVKYNDSFPTTSRSVSIITNSSSAMLSAPTIVTDSADITTPTATYKLKFPVYNQKDVLYLTGLKLERYISDSKSWSQMFNYSTKEDVARISPYSVTKGIYRATYKDNYNANTYEYNIYVGEYLINDFDKEYSFATKYALDKSTDIYYTGGAVKITYEGNIYSSILVNGASVSATDSTTILNKNCKTFTLNSLYDSSSKQAKDRIGESRTYIVDYYDITGAKQKSITIVIFDELPEILLTNGNDENVEIGSTTFESSSQITNSIVKVNWGTIDDCAYSAVNDSEDYQATTVNLYTKSDDGSYVLKESNLERGAIISEEGHYKLELKNSLFGNARYAYFAIQFGEFPLYSVTSNKKEIAPSDYEKLDITTSYLSDNNRLIDVIQSKLTEIKGNNRTLLTQIVDRDKSAYDVILESFGYRKDGNGTYVFSANNIGIANVTYLDHYYSIYDMDVIYNSNIDLDIIEFLFEDDQFVNYYIKGDARSSMTYSATKHYTTIYLVFSLKRTTKIELFATTKVPVATKILNDNLVYGAKATKNINILNNTSYDITDRNDLENGQLKIGFNILKSGQTSKWYNQGNYIYCIEQVGMDTTYSKVDISSRSNSSNYIYLAGSGTHRLKFLDLAGNVHRFTNNSLGSNPEVFTLYIITKVAYYVSYNGKIINPIESAIYNDGVSLQIDESYTSKIDRNSIGVNVLRNGQKYSNYSVSGNTYSFYEAGRYVVTFSATYKEKSLENAVCNFTILSTKSARLAYEFAGIPGYEIVKVMRNNVDITSSFQTDDKITSLFISSTDSRSGNGYYTITLKYGDRESDKLEYSFLINDYTPSITCNVAYGETTTDNINVSYNPSYIYNQLGRCYIVVYVYNSDSNAIYEFARFTIDEYETASLTVFTLTRSYTYFVQVKTETGNTISSFRVNKTDPLNSFAIIIIVISSIAFVVLLVVIIKLRTRMRVK